MKNITSKDNQFLKLARSLHIKKGRVASGCFLIEGLRLSKEAINSSLKIRYALISNQVDQAVLDLADVLEAKGFMVYSVPASHFAVISATEHSQGIALVAELLPNTKLLAGGKYYALCDSVADPGNMGNIIRSAFAAGVSGLILTPGCADIYNPKTVRSAMGGLFHLPIFVAATVQEAHDLVGQLEVDIYVGAANGQDISVNHDLLEKPHLWVLGSEAHGVCQFWQDKADKSVSIPMHENAESLNVAAAAAVLFYQSFFAK